MQIEEYIDEQCLFILRDGTEFGPYSVNAVNEYLANGELSLDDLCWSNYIGYSEVQLLNRSLSALDEKKRKKWVLLRTIQGIKIPEKLPAPPPFSSAVSTNNKNAGGCLELLCFFIPILGFILWLAYSGSNPKKAKSVGTCALIGFVVGVIGLFFLATLAGS